MKDSSVGRIYLSSPHMGGGELEYIKEVFDTNWVAPLGANVDGFEKDLQAFTGPAAASGGEHRIETLVEADAHAAGLWVLAQRRKGAKKGLFMQGGWGCGIGSAFPQGALPSLGVEHDRGGHGADREGADEDFWEKGSISIRRLRRWTQIKAKIIIREICEICGSD